jgi:hypothetical protein
MRVLLDHGTPHGIVSDLPGHIVSECKTFGWEELENGDLLDAAEAAGFDVFVTTDKGIRYQQNFSVRKIAIVVVGRSRWSLVLPMLSEVAAAVSAAKPGSFIEVNIPDH